MEGQSKLEQAAIDAREKNVVKNTYNTDNSYKATHTRALSDKETPVNGKGTGIFMDSLNGGGDYDINGVSEYPKSGRVGNLVQNQYNKDNTYKAPDMSGNKGQVNIG